MKIHLGKVLLSPAYKRMVAVIISITFFTITSFQAFSQYTTDKVVRDKHEDIADSLRTAVYPYIFPIWGQKVINKGFKIPKSAGISIQYVSQESDILISNLEVGFNNGPLYNLDQIVRFNNAVAATDGVNLRPDVWIFPFLNVYGVLARSKTSTTIDAGVYIPDSSGWNQITSINTKANFDATTVGFGITPTVGFGGFFFILDANFTWSDISALEKPAFIFILGPRIGKNWLLDLKRPDRNIAIWAGGFRVSMGTETKGSISTADLFPVEEWNQKIDEGYVKLGESQQKVDTWWEGLTPAEQRNPVNIAKYEAANAALTTYGNVLNAASGAVTGAANSSIQYSLSKKPKDPWNFLLGSQFQFNRSWMVRAEYGFLGSRTQLIVGVQYRFNW